MVRAQLPEQSKTSLNNPISSPPFAKTSEKQLIGTSKRYSLSYISLESSISEDIIFVCKLKIVRLLLLAFFRG